MSKFKDLTGQTIGEWEILRLYEKGNGTTKWECKCTCGKIKIVSRNNLLSGQSTQCKSCRAKKQKTKHGMSETRIYRIWKAMKTRTTNHNFKQKQNYSEKGILVCDEWFNDFEAFYNWSINNGYQENLTIDRKDNDKGYSPENCRWATMKEQANNTTRNKLIKYQGETKTLSQWVELLNLDYHKTKSRINKLGWSIEKAFETPTKR